MKAEVTLSGFLDMQVCVPSGWDDEQVADFANHSNPCGTENGWHIRKQGSKRLNGASERVACSESVGFVHIMLDA